MYKDRRRMRKEAKKTKTNVKKIAKSAKPIHNQNQYLSNEELD